LAEQTKTPGMSENGVFRDWSEASSFSSSLLSGILVGLVLDRWLGTGHWLLIAGLAAGFYSGTLRLYQFSKKAVPPQSKIPTEECDDDAGF